MVLTEEPRADTSVINGHEFVVLVSLTRVLAMVHVAQVVLFSLKEDYSEAVESESATYVIIEHSCTQVEPLVVLASLCQLPLLLRKLSHLEIDMCLFQKVALLDACFSLHDQILGRLPRGVRN